MIRPRRRDLFLLLCLVGVVPAFVTSTLPTTVWLPGVEGFRWAWFDLRSSRGYFALVLLVAAAVGWRLRPRWLWLAMLPLLVLVMTPVKRIGAAEGPLQWVEKAPFYPMEREWRATEALLTRPSPLDARVAHLPPALPDPKADLDKRWQDIAKERGNQLLRLREDRAKLDRQIARASPLIRDGLRRELRPAYARLDFDEARYLREAGPPSPALALELHLTLGLHELWRDSKRALWAEAPYQVVSALLAAAVVAALGIGHRVTLGFLGLALVASLVSAATRLTDGVGATVVLATALQPVFVGSLALILLRLGVRAWTDNREIWRSTPAPVLRRALSWSLLLWCPFALVLAANFWAGALVASRVESRIYCPSNDVERTPDGNEKCLQPDDTLWLTNSDPARETLREDLHIALARKFADVEREAVIAAGKTPGAAARLSRQVTDGVLGAYDKVFKPTLAAFPGMPARPVCELFKPLACLAVIPFDAAEAAYQRPRHRARNALEQRVFSTMGSLDRAVTTASSDVQRALRGESIHASRLVREHADAVLIATAGVAALGNAVLIFVALRAFLLILARLLFAQNKQAFMTITPREPPLADPAPAVRLLVPAGDELQLRLEQGSLLMKPAFDVDGAAPNTLWLPPQPWRASLARIRHGCWFLKEIEAPPAPAGASGESGAAGASRVEPVALTLKSTPGTNFFCWDIPAGTEVAFRWDRFAGMSASVGLRRVFSLKLGTLVLGHVTVATARGPGLLVQHAYTRASAQRNSVAQARVVGWLVGTLFRVESGKSKKNVYVDHCHVVCAEPGLAVHEAAREGRGGHGLWKELLGLLRP